MIMYCRLKGKRDLENRKSSYMLKPSRSSIFAKKDFKHHSTYHYKFCNVNNISLKCLFSLVLEYLRLISVETNYQQGNCS